MDGWMDGVCQVRLAAWKSRKTGPDQKCSSRCLFFFRFHHFLFSFFFFLWSRRQVSQSGLLDFLSFILSFFYFYFFFLSLWSVKFTREGADKNLNAAVMLDKIPSTSHKSSEERWYSVPPGWVGAFSFLFPFFFYNAEKKWRFSCYSTVYFLPLCFSWLCVSSFPHVRDLNVWASGVVQNAFVLLNPSLTPFFCKITYTCALL